MARVLIVEDNPEIGLMVGRLLEREGFEITSVRDGSEAIETISQQSYDAILLDLMMPAVSGFDVIEWMSEHRPSAAKSCVIVVTAAVRELGALDKSRVYATVAKPFDVFELLRVVRNCVAERSPSA